MQARSTLVLVLLGAGVPVTASANTFAPPMLDIAKQCNAMAHKNTTLMSECVVAESEARADLLQHWDKLPNASVERCLKAGKTVKRQPYVALEKCLSPEIAGAPSVPKPASDAASGPAEGGNGQPSEGWWKKLPRF